MTDTALLLTEAHIQRGLREALATKGFCCYHTGISLRSDRGFPDLVAIRERDGALVAIECKGKSGTIRSQQQEWIARFRVVPGCVFAEIVGPTTTERWLGYDEALARFEEIL